MLDYPWFMRNRARWIAALLVIVAGSCKGEDIDCPDGEVGRKICCVLSYTVARSASDDGCSMWCVPKCSTDDECSEYGSCREGACVPDDDCYAP